MICAIIGMGFGGLSVFAGLVKGVAEGAASCREVVLIDLEAHFARGLAYRADSATNLLNRPISAMHFVEEGDFTGWLKGTGSYKTGIGVSKYLPRHRFGEFLYEQLNQLISEARALGVVVHMIYDVAKSVDRHGDGFCVRTAGGTITLCDTCYLCVGSDLMKDPHGLKGKPFYHDSAYPVSDLRTSQEEVIGVIGSRLMAHDVVVGLRGRYKKIFLLSRSGLLPRVVTRYQPVTGAQSAANALVDRKMQGKARQTATLFRALREAFETVGLDFRGFLRGTCNTDRSVAFLRSMNVEICVAWASLNERQQRHFLRRYHRVWQQMRIPVSYRSAHMMDTLVRSQAVIALGGLESIKADGHGFVVNFRDRAAVRVDRVINASGLATTARANPLLLQMIDRGLLSEHPLGGIRVDPSDLTVLDGDHRRMEGLKCVGAMTYGDFYGVGNVDVVRWQAWVATRDRFGVDWRDDPHAQPDFDNRRRASALQRSPGSA